MKYIVIVVTIFICASAIAGPIFPSRSFIFAPKFRDKNDTTKGVKWLRNQGIWGNLARGFGSTEDRFAWSISTGGFIQLAEWDNSWLSIVGDFEVLADTHNDISFNPQGIFWTEGLLYSIRQDSTTEYQMGYIHRCRHDIDNLDTNIDGAAEERTLIYGSIMGRLIIRNHSFLGINTSTSGTLDLYLIKQDYRIPQELQDKKPSVKDLNLSLDLSMKFDLVHFGDALFYSRLGVRVAAYDWFKENDMHDYRLELGLGLGGEGTAMNIFAGYESLQDDYNSPNAWPTDYFYIGFRFIGKNVGI
jgi:hypothetical protein